MSLKKREPLDFVPMQKVIVSMTGTDLWTQKTDLNKACWRALSFAEQQQIISTLSHCQETIDSIMNAKFEELKNVHKTTESQPKSQPESETK